MTLTRAARSLLAGPSRLYLVRIPSVILVEIMTLCSIQTTHFFRNASSLVLAEHNGEAVAQTAYSAISAAKQLGGEVTTLVCGADCSKVVSELSQAEGVTKLLVAQDEGFKGFLPEALSPLILEAQKQFGFSHILSGASAMGKVS